MLHNFIEDSAGIICTKCKSCYPARTIIETENRLIPHYEGVKVGDVIPVREITLSPATTISRRKVRIEREAVVGIRDVSTEPCPRL